jgi:hypothetical protein
VDPEFVKPDSVKPDLAQSEPSRVPQHSAADGEDKPLDPATEAVRRKMVRLLLGSFGVMVLGLIAVFSAIVYKMSTGAVSIASGPLEAEIALPAGSRILSTSLDGPHALIHIAVPGNALGEMVIVETESGRIIRRFTLTSP